MNRQININPQCRVVKLLYTVLQTGNGRVYVWSSNHHQYLKVEGVFPCQRSWKNTSAQFGTSYQRYCICRARTRFKISRSGPAQLVRLVLCVSLPASLTVWYTIKWIITPCACVLDSDWPKDGPKNLIPTAWQQHQSEEIAHLMVSDWETFRDYWECCLKHKNSNRKVNQGARSLSEKRGHPIFGLVRWNKGNFILCLWGQAEGFRTIATNTALIPTWQGVRLSLIFPPHQWGCGVSFR